MLSSAVEPLRRSRAEKIADRDTFGLEVVTNVATELPLEGPTKTTAPCSPSRL